MATEASREPGGGRILRLTDPDGYMVEVVAGQTCDAATRPVFDAPRNTAAVKARLRAAPLP